MRQRTDLAQPVGVVRSHVLLLSPRHGVVMLHQPHGAVQGKLALSALLTLQIVDNLIFESYLNLSR